VLAVITLFWLVVNEAERQIPQPFRDFRKNSTAEVSPQKAAEPQHDAGDTVRASAGGFDLKGGALTVFEPQWNNPFNLTFSTLVKEYRHYKTESSFIPDGLPKMNGGAVSISGAVMPIDAPPESGEMRRFWLANPTVVMAGCVFCNPPTLADLIYVNAESKPLKVDREELYRGVMVVRILGRFFVEAAKTADGVEYLFRMEMKELED